MPPASPPSPLPPVPTRIAAVIVGAGRGHRFGSPLPKQYVDLAGRPVLSRTLDVFVSHPAVAWVQPVIHMDDLALFNAAAQGFEVRAPVAGGASRQASVLNGLKALEELSPDLVLIHDAARPFVTAGDIDAIIAALADHPGAIPALAVADTLKRGGQEGHVEGTVSRDGLWRAQTPQGFRYGDILKAHHRAAGNELTDDAAVAEASGLTVALVPGSEDNFKITTPQDLARGEALITGLAGPRPFGDEKMMESRIGTGFDVHKFGPGDKVILCGLEIPHTQALTGHSDADVGLHALTDALLGAIGEGDIGQHFPPTDPQWKGAPSDQFLAHAGKLVSDKGGKIINVDLTLICQAPKIGPHRPAMEAKVAEILGIDVNRVCVKATTTEQLGFTGREEGIAAQAAASVALPHAD